MYNGKYKYSLEEKGRIFIPVKFRRGLMPDDEDTFVVTKGYDGCLALYPLNEWRKVGEKLKKYPTNDSKSRKTARWFSANAEVVKLDSQGRIKVPQHLVDFAKLVKEVVIIGVFNRIELWEPKAYEKEEKESDPTKLGGIEGLNL
ncbi:division/cell wall cluster transcriptional repressor MraZ [candidate division WOR-3 bacterium]|nr:division/cell wall cluster transcriptional repressor MraZ [candidate division WOR-3 bacterium]